MKFARLLALILLASPALAAVPAAPVRTRVTVEKEGGVWWFKDAAGKRFFSLGVCCTGGCFGHAEEAPIEPARRSWILESLKKWGFNTAAAWSSPSVWEGMYIAEELYPPFAPWDFDVFDDKQWTSQLFSDLRNEMRDMAGRPNLIGYFIDNEPQWPGPRCFRQYRRMKPGSPGSRRLVEAARKFYGGDLKALNRAWHTKFTAFTDIAGAPGARLEAGAIPGGFLSAWRDEVAEAYYGRYSAWVRQIDPGCLILGERHSGVPEMDYIKAIGGHFDVISVNDYDRYGELSPAYADIYRELGKPLMITEWSFSGYPKSGFKSLQFVEVYTQENRAKGYRKYVSQAARAPFMLGMHWFLWEDYGPWKGTESDVTGEEEEGEYWPDKNMGLVSTGEKKVYKELVEECARTNGEVEALHAASAGWKPAPGRPDVVKDLPVFEPAVDGDPREWPAALAVRPYISESLAENPPFDHTYWLSRGAKGLYVAADVTDDRLDFPGADWAWEGDYLGVELEFTSTATGAQSCYFQLYPIGAGQDGQSPYAAAWWGKGDGAKITVVKRLKPGGFTMEALIPPDAVPGITLAPGARLKVTLNYRNVSGIYETRWAGDLTLK